VNQKDYFAYFVRFIESEKTKIDIDKWNRGVSLGKDPGDNYVLDWINLNASWFRTSWNNSKCKTCIHWKWCGWRVENNCEGHIPEH
jgi:hypothetical protein